MTIQTNTNPPATLNKRGGRVALPIPRRGHSEFRPGNTSQSQMLLSQRLNPPKGSSCVFSPSVASATSPPRGRSWQFRLSSESPPWGRCPQGRGGKDKGSFGIPTSCSSLCNKDGNFYVSIPRRGHSEFRQPKSNSNTHSCRVSIPRRGHSEFRRRPSFGLVGQRVAGCFSERSSQKSAKCRFFCISILADFSAAVKQKIFLDI